MTDNSKEEKDINSIMDGIDKISPYATYLSENTLSSVDEWIDTGSMVLNAIISGSLYGGIPKGRVTQLAGPSQVFKSGLMLKILANAQKQGMHPIILDTEGAIDAETAKSFGLDITKVKYITPESAEDARNIINKILTEAREKGLIGKFIIAIDSLANLQSEMELTRMEKDSKSADMGTNAKAIKSLLKRCTTLSSFTKTPIIVTNHVYDDPSSMYPSLEKNMNGGKAAVYLPSVTVQLSRKPLRDEEAKKEGENLAPGQKKFSGIVLKALTVKNRFVKQYLEGEMFLSFSKGLHKYFGLLEIMKGMGVVENSGPTYTDWEGNKLGYYGNWKKDTDLWENRLLPELESRIKSYWAYGNEVGMEDEEVLPEEE